MQSGRGGMGSHKHGTSGQKHRPHNADKQMVERDVNRLNERIPKPKEMYDSVQEAFAASRRKGKR